MMEPLITYADTASINDIMAFLYQEKRENREREEQYKKEIEDLRNTVTALSLDLKSLQESVPNWGSLDSAQPSSSHLSGSVPSYADVVMGGIALPVQRRDSQASSVSKGSRVSFDPIDQDMNSSPRRSPPLSLPTTIRSAMRKTRHDLERDMVIDLRNMEKESESSESSESWIVKTKEKIVKAIRSNKGLAGIPLKEFRIRHTNEDVNLAYFKLPREAEEQVRQNAATWIDKYLRGAKLIEPAWYPVKIDFVDKAYVMDPDTGKVKDSARTAFAKENEVDVKLMRWLGQPKEYAAYASAVVKVATKMQAEKLLQADLEGVDVTIFGCTVKVSQFREA